MQDSYRIVISLCLLVTALACTSLIGTALALNPLFHCPDLSSFFGLEFEYLLEVAVLALPPPKKVFTVSKWQVQVQQRVSPKSRSTSKSEKAKHQL